MPGLDETASGTEAPPLSRTEQLETHLQQLAAAHDNAMANGKWSDAALIDVDHRDLFVKWCVAQQDEVTRHLEAIKSQAQSIVLRIGWWLELGRVTEEPVEVSPFQKQIFKDGDFRPRSWGNAREALETTEKYRRPSSGDLASWKSSGTEIMAEAGRLEKYLSEFHAQLDVHDCTDPSWETYYNEKAPALRRSLGQYEYLWEISDLVP